jgi:hypothetical protein
MSNSIQFHQTRLRADKVAWLIRRGLSRRERICKWLIGLSGLALFLAIGYAKQAAFTLEALLSLVPVLVALGMRTTARLASTADSAETYDSRVVQPGAEFDRLAAELNPRGVDVVSPAGNYHYFINPREVHWARPWYSLNWKPFRLTWIFGLFGLLVQRGFHLPKWPGLAELQLLEFQAGQTTPLVLLCAAISLLGIATVAASFKRGLTVGCSGGVVEQLFLYPEDQPRLLGALEDAWEAGPASAPVIRAAAM